MGMLISFSSWTGKKKKKKKRFADSGITLPGFPANSPDLET